MEHQHNSGTQVNKATMDHSKMNHSKYNCCCDQYKFIKSEELNTYYYDEWIT
jgi:hypothetical protein